MNTIVKFTRLRPFAAEPVKSTPHSVGFDLYAIDDQVILPGKTTKFNTGIALDLELSNTYPRIASRSSLALFGVVVVAGVVDPDYQGEICVLLLNTSDQPYEVKAGHRIAQLIFERYRDDILFEETETLTSPPTERNDGGFGSTGQ